MWQPDGWGWRARIGLIVPHADVCAESEIHAIAPDGVSIHAARVFFEAMASDPNMNEDIELEAIRGYVHSVDLDAAAETLSGAPLSVVAFAFTSTSYLGGAATRS